ncbi:F-box/LRR-repeat protein 7-like [Sinocyclocheilus grahami]|uniref:F-box/LRR-repeat protein 7-like n=1 Tax=Sinocyclocheilus grahami TaxID=75366 RepID=UPI0007AD06D8|nr:PREDICTED: F-box/LRR-repeat protein 7-like [Sinocyclocheilus grahami]
MGANNGKQCGSEGKGSSSISSDVSSSTDHTPTKAPKNVATSEDSDLSMRTLSTPSPALILKSNPSCVSPQTVPNGHETSSTSFNVTGETVALVHPPPGTRSRPSKVPPTTLIDILPDPVLLHVLSYLSTPQLCRCARVCHRWYNLAWDPRLWSTIRLNGELLNADRALKVLTHRLCCPKVTCISLTEEASLQLTPLHGQQIGLRYLDMTDCVSLEDKGLRTIAFHCPRLTHLYLRRCSHLTDEALRQLALHCTTLRELSLSDCPLIGDFGLREVARLEGRLRYLSVAHCMRITDVGLRYVARYCPRLRYLNARGCEGLTDQGLSHLARNCPRLRSIDVGRCPLVSDTGLEVLARCCEGLRRLSLRGCESLTGRGLMALAAGCPKLQLLNVQECEVPPEALRLVRKHCRRCVIEHTIPALY